MTEKINENSDEFQLLYKKLLNVISTTKNTPIEINEENITISIDIPQNSSTSSLSSLSSSSSSYKNIPKIITTKEILEHTSEEDTYTQLDSVSDYTDESDNISQTDISSNNITENVLHDLIKELGRKRIIKCKGCEKSFNTRFQLDKHINSSKPCETVIKLLKDDVILNRIKRLPNIELNRYVENLVETIITGNSPQRCKYCNIQFSSTGNHHKHYTSAIACNRLAYLDFIENIIHNIYQSIQG
jgi:hypothetical protein